MPTAETPTACGTVAPTTEAVLDAVREANGRRALRPARTVDGAEADVRAYVVAPEWYAGETAAAVAADVLRGTYGVDAATAPPVWAVYAEGARRVGFAGGVPVPVLASGIGGTARPAEA